MVLETLKLHLPGLECVVVDEDPALWGGKVLDAPVAGGDADLASWPDKGFPYFAVGVGGVGNNGPRRNLFELAVANGLEPMSVIHPSAIVSGWAAIGAGAQLLAGSIVNPDANLGKNVIVNSGAVIEHDCIIADHAHVATGARLAGNVRVGTGAHIGIGAVLKQGVTVGPGAIVGAGASVVEDVAEHVTVVGVPARPLKK